MSLKPVRVVSALVAGSCAIVVASCGRPASPSTGTPAAPATPQAASAVPAARQANQALPQDVAAIVEAYRKIIVLVEDESSLSQDDRQRA